MGWLAAGKRFFDLNNARLKSQGACGSCHSRGNGYWGWDCPGARWLNLHVGFFHIDFSARGCSVVVMDLESQKNQAGDLLEQIKRLGATGAFIGQFDVQRWRRDQRRSSKGSVDERAALGCDATDRKQIEVSRFPTEAFSVYRTRRRA